MIAQTYGVYIPNHGSNPRQASASSRDDTDIFICILTGFALSIGVIIQVGK
jgi:hypothetical protein